MRVRAVALASFGVTLASAVALGQVPIAPPASEARPVPASGEAEAPAPPVLADLDEPPLFGDTGRLVYLRDRRDFIRIYPHARLDTEAHGFFGSRVSSLRADQAGVDLGPAFIVRHARFELGGEALERLAFDFAFDLVENPALDGARADARKTRVGLDAAWTYIDAGRGLGLMMGVFQAPFSLENRTQVSELAFMERSVATRGFAVPASRVLGASLEGSTYLRQLSWSVGAFGGEALGTGSMDRSFDGIGRVSYQPFITHASWPLQGLELGVSLRAGTRNPRDNHSDAPAITTRQGFALWRPTRVDADGQTVHILQTGTQRGIGLELRLPSKCLTLRGEGYYMNRQTRETLEPAASTPGLRGGSISGFAGYVELSSWPLAGLLDSDQPSPGRFPHPEHLELWNTVPFQERHGIELAALAGGIGASYDAQSRSGTPDPSVRSKRIRIWELGFAVNYWHTARFKIGANLNAYITPKRDDNLAGVPGNLGPPEQADLAASHLYELAVRATLQF